jgi:TatD DNase family protein
VPTWVDTHCHLQLAAAATDELLDRAAAAGVGWVVAPGTDEATSAQSMTLATRYPGRVVGTAGLHPHDASRWPEVADRIAGLAETAGAVGECGLDFYRTLSPREAQMAAFREQVSLASDLDKPLIVHCRDAFAEVYSVLEEAGAAGERIVLHCWTGGPRWTRRFDALGVTFSFAGPVTFETGDTVRRGAAVASPDHCMVETDTPYLTPPPNRRLPNEPANVIVVGEALAEVWGTTPDEVARLTTATAQRVFRS